ncbi:MAG: hypothetical protein KF681_07495 [Bdellovibrionaceae bacterium]|nr:hypothetical protein [Pseudobdellovibrionaceae bacterium]
MLPQQGPIVKIVLAMVTPFYLVGCVTLPPDGLFNKDEIPRLESPKCIGVTIERKSLELDGEIRPIRGFVNESQTYFDLKNLGFLTNCPNPVDNYKITISLTQKNIAWTYVKGLLTIATLTLIPFSEDISHQVTVTKSNGTVLLDKEIVIQKRVWLFYLGKWFELEDKATDTYRTYVPNAIFMKEIGKALKSDLESK